MIRFFRRLWRRLTVWRESPYGRGLFEKSIQPGRPDGVWSSVGIFDDPHHHACDLAVDDGECYACGVRDCPGDEPLHYHHDGCPQCSFLSTADD